MRPLLTVSAYRILVGILLFGLLGGCSGKKLSSGAGDQSSIPGAKPQALAPVSEPSPAVQEPPRSSMEVPRMDPTRPMEEARVTEPSAAPLPQIAQAPVARPVEPPPPTESSGTLQDVYFDFDQSSLRSDARTTLEENARLLRGAGGGKVLIEGHCDERGTAAYNLILGESRAKSVKRYLENLGISAAQLQIVSYGKERPFCKDHNDACWQSNRRAHFVMK